MTMDDPYAGVDEAVEWAEDLTPYSKLTHMKYNKDKKDADTVGSPSPASVEPPAPSEIPFPQEPTNASFSADGIPVCETCDFMQSHSPNNMVEKDDGSWKCQGCGEITETFSATTERVIITLGDDPEDDEDEEEEEIEEETEDEDEDEEESPSDENGEEDDSDEEKDEKVEDEDEEQEEEEDSEEEDEDEEEFEAISVEVEREKKEDKDEDEDEDGLLTPMNVALGLGAVALGVAVLGAEGVCGCGIDCVCDCGCAESGVCNCGESCPCDCGCGVESFGTDSLVEEPDWIPDGDGRALGQQNLDINLSPLHAEQNEYHTSNVFYADEDVQKMTSSEFVPFDQITSEIQQEWDETTAPIAADYEPLDEPTNANFSADTSDIALSQEEIEEIERGMDIDLSSFKQRIANGASAKNVIETYRIRGRHNRKELMDYEKRLYETETVGSPSPTFNEGITGQDGPSAEPTNADFSAEETSMKQGWTITYFGDKRDTRMAKKDGLAVMIEKLSKTSYQHKTNGVNWIVHYGRYVDDGKGGRIIPLAELFRTYNGIFKWLNNPPFTIHNHAETVGSPSPTFDEGITGQDGPSAEPTNADFSAEGGLSKNAQYAIGLAALGVGIALWNGDWVSKMFDRFKR